MRKSFNEKVKKKAKKNRSPIHLMSEIQLFEQKSNCIK